MTNCFPGNTDVGVLEMQTIKRGKLVSTSMMSMSDKVKYTLSTVTKVLPSKRPVKRIFLCVQIFLFHCEYGKTKKKLFITAFIFIRMTSVDCNASLFIATLFPLDMTTGRAENLSMMGK